MNIRHTLILAVSIVSLLSGCITPSDEARVNDAAVQSLMRDRSWPRIEQIAKDEVKKRELLTWPDNASYLPVEHKDKVWGVTAMTGTSNGDVQRVISLMIGDDGAVLAYKRHWEGER
ncbi:MAG TPA: hypothetical protein VHS31_09080 [Tepidisphaeraceae bacterium]|nr:hypothetical protein [Tepidisphaeraceae bacterium]